MADQKKKEENAKSDALLVEAHRINYRLRSTFFLQKLREYDTLGLPFRIAELSKVEGAYSWDDRKNWHIDDEAFASCQASQIETLHVFCHPKLIREHPGLVAYYCHIAVLSQKSVKYLANLDVRKWEREPVAVLSSSDAIFLASLFNNHISLIVNSSVRGFEKGHLTGLLLASTGSQIDGSWRNAIGDEAEKAVQRLLVKEALTRGILVAMIRRSDNGHQTLYDTDEFASDFDISKYKGFLLNNKTSILFSSEPDISLLNTDGTTAAVIEVKGGTDPAGALERYGAAKKSFEAAIAENDDVVSILIASCITSEVDERISGDESINHYFNLTQILSDEDELERLMECVFSHLDL